MKESFFKAGKTLGGFLKALVIPAILSVVATICSKILMTRLSDIIRDYIEVAKSTVKKN